MPVGGGAQLLDGGLGSDELPQLRRRADGAAGCNEWKAWRRGTGMFGPTADSTDARLDVPGLGLTGHARRTGPDGSGRRDQQVSRRKGRTVSDGRRAHSGSGAALGTDRMEVGGNCGPEL